MGTPRGRYTLLATILGSGLAMLDSTVVNIALPTIGRDFDAGLGALQWCVNAYTLTLSGLLLLGGALGDRYGRRRIYVIGIAWFALASLACGIAPSVETLIAARALQGVGAALLVPGSLALIEASFVATDRGAAIGAWSGLGSVAAAIGPFLGGYLIDAVSWRLVFFINLPLAAAAVLIATRHVPESRDPGAQGRALDVRGGVLVAFGLAGVTYALSEGPRSGFGQPFVLLAGLAGLVGLVAFVLAEHTSPNPLAPLEMFRSRQFSAANAATFVVYAALVGALFLLPIQLQQVVDLTPLESGAAIVPLTLVMLVLSSRSGRIAGKIGPRLPMTVGPIVMGLGLVLLSRVDAGAGYVADVLPGVLVFALGLAATVAPLTTTVLAAASENRTGVASAINNDIARIAGLVAVALLPTLAGIGEHDFDDPAAFSHGFHRAFLISAALCVAGGLLSFATIRRGDLTASGA